ncbi:hypothetical protein BFJ63_vAg18501 [Fusarium oxysporum f. sp. narcissi]|uniref:Uncharacterized protein n=1 Tax=Fusarium oxysporum f. sp. narcissi TaxID=451672 RepID=A0A4Q2V460_FUSOX|nr:hypothetical protein BFJ63_vAg18501 [Fusarium oxysporum f. sp. narcissi]
MDGHAAGAVNPRTEGMAALVLLGDAWEIVPTRSAGDAPIRLRNYVWGFPRTCPEFLKLSFCDLSSLFFV